MAKFVLRKVAAQRHLDAVELQRLTHLSPSTIHKLLGGKTHDGEIGRIDLKTLGTLMDALGVGVDQLITHDSMVEHLRTRCDRIRIIVGARHSSNDGGGNELSKDGLRRDFIDPWDVRSISDISSALAAVNPGRGADGKRASQEIIALGRTQKVALPDFDGAGTLTVTVGSPMSNPMLLPMINHITGGRRLRLRLRMKVEPGGLDARSHELSHLLIDPIKKDSEQRGIVTPDGALYVATPRSELVASTREGDPYLDAGVILYCQDPMFVGIFGCGGTGTLGAARYLREQRLVLLTRGKVPAHELSGDVLRVRVNKPTAGTEDDREVLVPPFDVDRNEDDHINVTGVVDGVAAGESRGA